MQMDLGEHHLGSHKTGIKCDENWSNGIEMINKTYGKNVHSMKIFPARVSLLIKLEFIVRVTFSLIVLRVAHDKIRGEEGSLHKKSLYRNKLMRIFFFFLCFLDDVQNISWVIALPL